MLNTLCKSVLNYHSPNQGVSKYSQLLWIFIKYRNVIISTYGSLYLNRG